MALHYKKLRPPGTWCQHFAFFDLVKPKSGTTFLEVGCGAGDFTEELLRKGLTGVAIEQSPAAAEIAQDTLSEPIQNKTLKLITGDFLAISDSLNSFDLVISFMVLEHIEDDLGFAKALMKKVKPGGKLIIGVPGRQDKWGAEDEIAGHFRRYERSDLRTLLGRIDEASGIKVYSVGVPTMNVLKGVSDYLVGHSQKDLLDKSQTERTQKSGIMEVPFKHTFPPVFKIVLNPIVMWPLMAIQKIFYKSDFGIMIMGIASRGPSNNK